MKTFFKNFLVFFLILMLVSCETSKISLKNGVYEGEGSGNNSNIKVEVAVKKGKIGSIKIIEFNETKGLGDSATDTLIEMMVFNNSTNVDSISGATNSSDGLKEAVRDALKKAGADEKYFENEIKVVFDKEELNSDYSFDVVIIGAGGAGLSAAVEASKSGASVAVLEKTPYVGGNTLVSGGGLNVPKSRQQIKLGIEDSIELFYNDTLKGGDNVADENLVKVLANNALDSANWLMDEINVEFLDSRVQQFGGHSVPRALIPVGNKGIEMISKLKKVAEDNGVKIFYETRAFKLNMDDTGVTGVIAKNNDKDVLFKANKGIIIASGGFASDVEMRKKYNPNYDERFKTTATLASTGDGIKIAQEIGAGVRDMQYIQVYPTCNPLTGIISYVANSRFDGAILVNSDAERFIDEMGRRDVISNAILKQKDEVAYLIWGQEIETVGNMTKMHEKEFEQWKKDDLIYVGDSIDDIAKHYGIDAKKLNDTINKYNEYVDKGKDSEFNRGGNLRKIEKGNFYIQKVVPSAHHTMGGLTINTNAQVLDVNGEIIKKLYAAGEVVGGIHGTNRLGGNAITDIVVYGRIAGSNVVK